MAICSSVNTESKSPRCKMGHANFATIRFPEQEKLVLSLLHLLATAAERGTTPVLGRIDIETKVEDKEKRTKEERKSMLTCYKD